MLNRIFFGAIFSLVLISCHPFYKRLTRGNWEKDTVWIKFTDLPQKVQDTLIAENTSKAPVDITKNSLISLDPGKQFTNMGYYDSYSSTLRLPFGQYFKLGGKKYFINYSELRSPIIYYEEHLYFPTGKFFEPLTEKEKYDDNNREAFRKAYYTKYNLGR